MKAEKVSFPPSGPTEIYYNSPKNEGNTTYFEFIIKTQFKGYLNVTD